MILRVLLYPERARADPIHAPLYPAPRQNTRCNRQRGADCRGGRPGSFAWSSRTSTPRSTSPAGTSSALPPPRADPRCPPSRARASAFRSSSAILSSVVLFVFPFPPPAPLPEGVSAFRQDVQDLQDFGRPPSRPPPRHGHPLVLPSPRRHSRHAADTPPPRALPVGVRHGGHAPPGVMKSGKGRAKAAGALRMPGQKLSVLLCQ